MCERTGSIRPSIFLIHFLEKCVCIILLLCLQVALSQDTPVEMRSNQCSCAAVNGFCQHVVALLYQASHFQKLRLKRVPPITSKTSVPQGWHIPHAVKIVPLRYLAKKAWWEKKKTVSGRGTVNTLQSSTDTTR